MKHRPDSLSGRIAAYCDTPRTMAEIQAAFAPGHDAKRVGWLVQDLVHNESLVNLNRGKGRRVGGLYQGAGTTPEAAGPAAEPAATATGPTLNLIDSIVAWCSQPRCMAAIEAEFAGRSNNPSSIVYNAVKAGLIVNLVDTAKHGRGWGGVYVQAHLRQAFWPQEPPGRTRRKRACKVAAAPPPPIPAKRRVSFHSYIPPSPLAGGPQWSNLDLVNAWAGSRQQPQDEPHA